MKKFLLLAALGAMSAGAINALPVNKALSFTSEGSVNCGAMPELKDLSSYSLQFWMSPDAWTEGATVFKRGDNFSVKLGADKSLVFTNGDNTVTATGLKDGWNQITLIVSNGEASVLVNSTEGGKGTLGTLEDTKRGFIMGGGYAGLLDEVRVWNAALNDEMARYDYFTNNTLNKWNPMWENLVAYYKMDQEDPDFVVEYKVLEEPKAEDHHGVLSDSGVSYVAAGNDAMPYLVSAAYTENARFYDRLIPQDAYLLSNEIIILGADCVGDKGSVKLRTPNNHGKIKGGVTHVATKGDREGVIYLDGQAGSYIEAPAESVHAYTADGTTFNTDLDQFTFITRLYFEEWKPGAKLLSKGTGDKGIEIYLDEAESAEDPTVKEKKIIVKINGDTYISPSFKNNDKDWNRLDANVWNHIGIQALKNTRGVLAIAIVINGQNYAFDNIQLIQNPSLKEVAEEPIKIGSGFKGWLDETYFTNSKAVGPGMIQTYRTSGVIIPSIEQGRNVEEMAAAGFLYNYDNPDSEMVGYSSFSQDEMLNQIKKAYEGYTAPRVILSVRGHSDNTQEDAFLKIGWKPETAANFAKELWAAAEKYDGAEFDFEWVENKETEKITNFQNVAKAVIEAKPDNKIFRISIHNSYYVFAKEQITDKKVAGFTVQQYGPNDTPFPYSSFTNALSTLKTNGYSNSQLMTSFSTTFQKIGNNQLTARSFGFEGYTLPEIGETRNVDTYNSYSYMGPYQVYQRAKYTRENGYMGIFYWDMGNEYWLGNRDMGAGSGGKSDYQGMPEYNQTKFANFALSANVDKIANVETENHPETEAEPGDETTQPGTPEEPGEGGEGGTTGVQNILNAMPDYVDVYSTTGVVVKRNMSKDDLNSLGKGLYIINGKKIQVK